MLNIIFSRFDCFRPLEFFLSLGDQLSFFSFNHSRDFRVFSGVLGSSASLVIVVLFFLATRLLAGIWRLSAAIRRYILTIYHISYSALRALLASLFIFPFQNGFILSPLSLPHYSLDEL